VLAHQGLYYRKRKGVFSSFSIFTLYMILMAIMIAGEAWGLVWISSVIKELQTVLSKVKATETDGLPFKPTEKYIASLFNGFFFSNSNGMCESVSSVLFWHFIDSYCPESIQQNNCKKCYTFGVGNCPADQNTCYSSSQATGSTCPYMICRASILDYSVLRLRYSAHLSLMLD
jgi:hypothetical protein